MAREEVQELLARIQSAFPNFNPANKTFATDTWLLALGDYSKNEVIAALKIYMQTSTSGFAPTPGQLIEKIYMLRKPQALNEMEAWALVSKAIRNSGYNSVEEFSKLPPPVQRAVGIPEQLRVWALDEHYNEQVVSSNFMRSYQKVISNEEEYSKLPDSIKLIIKKANEASDAARIEQRRNDTIRQHQIGQNEEKLIGCTEICTGVPERLKTKYRKLFEEE